MDGGIRSGQDLLKAVAHGARGTLIGRAFNFGLGAMGEAGVTRALEIIRAEFDTSMALCGVRNVAGISRAILLNPEVTTAGVGHVFKPDDAGKVDFGHYWVLTVGLSD